MSEYILLVDDDEDSRDIFGMSLEMAGYTVKHAANGLEALSVLERDLPILIITDIMMPEMNGFALLTELRKRPKVKDIPVIVISATGDSSVLQQQLMGVRLIYKKGSFSSQKFIEAVKEVLGHAAK